MEPSLVYDYCIAEKRCSAMTMGIGTFPRALSCLCGPIARSSGIRVPVKVRALV